MSKWLIGLAKHMPENHGVGGSIPPLGTTHINNLALSLAVSMVHLV